MRTVWRFLKKLKIHLPCMCVYVLNCISCVRLFVNPWTVAHHTLSTVFSRQEYWSGLACSPSRHLPDPGIEPTSLTTLALAGKLFTTSTTWKAHNYLACVCVCVCDRLHSVMSDSLKLHEHSPWNSLGQNTRVDSHSLLQGIFPTQGSNPGFLHCRGILYQLSH